MQVGWDDRGKGTLTVRQSKAKEDETAESANIVFTMESGKVIVNGAVYKTLKIQKARRSSILSRCWQLHALADEVPTSQQGIGQLLSEVISHDALVTAVMLQVVHRGGFTPAFTVRPT